MSDISEQSLRARWLALPASSLDEVKARWRPHPWPALVRFRVVYYRHPASADFVVSHVCSSRVEASRYIAGLQQTGRRLHGPSHRYDLRIRRAKLPPSFVLLQTRIPCRMLHYEPVHVVPVIALVYELSGRVTAHYRDGQRHRFASLDECLSFYHRSLEWLARAPAFHART